MYYVGHYFDILPVSIFFMGLTRGDPFFFFLFPLLFTLFPICLCGFFFFLFFLLSFGDQRVEHLFLPPNSYIFLLPIFYLHPSFLFLFLYSLNGRVVGYLMSDVLSHPFLIPDFEQL